MSLFTKRNINAKKMGHTSQVFMHVCVLFACTQTRLFIFPPFIFSRGTLNKAWLTAPTKHLFCLSTTIKWAFIEHRAETKTSYSKPGFTSQSNPLRVNEMYVCVSIFTVLDLMSSKTTTANVNCFLHGTPFLCLLSFCHTTQTVSDE